MAKVRYATHSFRAPANKAVCPFGQRNIGDYRNLFMKDRDRILYSKAFRRLAGKTQIYGTGINDHMRTRLTHTLEVNQIAKTIANYLKLDVDLTEAIALGHDIGHTPFGHAGERILHELTTLNVKMDADLPSRYMGKDGQTLESDPLYGFYGFKHNWQSAAVALREETETPMGLNLTNFTLYGMVHHTGPIYKRNKVTGNLMAAYDWLKPFMKLKNSETDAWSFESFVVKQADEIAQRHHDLEDAILGNQLTQAKICDDIETHFSPFMDRRGVESNSAFQALRNERNPEKFASRLSEYMLNLLITRIINISGKNIEWLYVNRIKARGICFGQYMLDSQQDLEDGILDKIIAFDPIESDGGPSFSDAVKSLEDLITGHVIASHDVQSKDAHGSYIITSIFKSYYQTPTQLPDHCVKEFLETKGVFTREEIERNETAYGIGYLRKTFASLAESEGLDAYGKMVLIRTICNYISGMTDTYAMKIYKELY